MYGVPELGRRSFIAQRVQCRECGYRFKFRGGDADISPDGYSVSIPMEIDMNDEAKFGTTQAGPRSAVEMSPTASAARDLEVANALVKDLERKSQDVRDELSGAIRNRDQAEQKLAEVVLPQMKDATIEQHLKDRIARERRPVRD